MYIKNKSLIGSIWIKPVFDNLSVLIAVEFGQFETEWTKGLTSQQASGLKVDFLTLVSKVLEGFDSFGKVAVELGHAGGEERVDHRAREEAAQVCLEEAEHLGFVGLSGRNTREK